MPFAPIVRDIDADRFFKLKNGPDFYEYMTITAECHPLAKKEAPAIVHVDNTARPQVLRRSKNEFVYDLLTEYNSQSKLSILVNTSFNVRNEPIVESPWDAIRCFLTTDLDVLVIEKYLVEKINQNPVTMDIWKSKNYVGELD
jgi:carbamoyltransferase